MCQARIIDLSDLCNIHILLGGGGLDSFWALIKDIYLHTVIKIYLQNESKKHCIQYRLRFVKSYIYTTYQNVNNDYLWVKANFIFFFNYVTGAKSYLLISILPLFYRNGTSNFSSTHSHLEKLYNSRPPWQWVVGMSMIWPVRCKWMCLLYDTFQRGFLGGKGMPCLCLFLLAGWNVSMLAGAEAATLDLKWRPSANGVGAMREKPESLISMDHQSSSEHPTPTWE